MPMAAKLGTMLFDPCYLILTMLLIMWDVTLWPMNLAKCWVTIRDFRASHTTL